VVVDELVVIVDELGVAVAKFVVLAEERDAPSDEELGVVASELEATGVLEDGSVLDDEEVADG
jgi:hypothetical protein